jgi:hypothetical protein
MSMMMKDLEEKIKNLPPEYRSIMNNGIIIELSNVKNRISEQIYDSKKQELIEKLDTQINFILPESLKNEKYDSIKKDLTFYKKAYESEAANVNKIIEATNKLNHELYEPLKNIKNELNKHCTDLKNNVNNIVIPHDGMNKGIDSIKNNDIVEKNKKEFENDKVDLNKSMNSYRDKAIEFFKDYNIMNDDLTSSIKDFLNSFNQLRNNVNELKHEINEGFKIFENISPELEDLEDKEKIRELTESLLFPLDKITKLISESQNKLEILKPADKIEKIDLTKSMVDICTDLKNKSNKIAEKINLIRTKANLENIDIPPLELKEPEVKKINEGIDNMMKDLEDTKKENEILQNELLKRTEDFINQSRLDIIFIIDCTNSVNTYLNTIKKDFTKMIDKIQEECQMAKIYIGFVGYLDLSDLDFGEVYTNINLTTDLNLINEKIKNLKPTGGGDTAEDIAGAFELALNNDWKGFSRFAILAADSPCHGNEFHGKAKVKNYDNFPEGDPKKRDIKEFVRKFAEKKISLFCAKLSDDTDIMFDIFKKEYEKAKKPKSKCQFIIKTCEDLCDIITKNAIEVYHINRKVDVDNSIISQ